MVIDFDNENLSTVNVDSTEGNASDKKARKLQSWNVAEKVTIVEGILQGKMRVMQAARY